jgi:hypothetical protein
MNGPGAAGDGNILFQSIGRHSTPDTAGQQARADRIY